MRDVSCRAFDAFFRQGRLRGIPPEELVRNTNYSIEHFRNRHERVEWETVVAFMANVRRYWQTDEELVALGEAFTRSPLVRSLTIIGRLLFTAKDFFRWVASAGEGAGNQLFSCVRPGFEDLGGDRIQIALTLRTGLEPCSDFFLVTKGCFIALPRLLGLAPAEVRMSSTSTGVIYDVRVPPGGGILTALWRALTWPFAIRTAARELKDANQALTKRNQQLESARQELDRQATALRTADSIGKLIHSALDLDRTVGAVANALVSVAGFVAAEVRLHATVEGRTVERRETVGQIPNSVEAFEVPLVGRGDAIGALRVWSPPGSDIMERRELLGIVAPTVSMALMDALAYTALSDYRANLEQRVGERTRDLELARDHLQATVDEMREAQAARERIFANINHEIRTPLSLVMLSASDIQARQGHLLDERARGELDAIGLSARQLLRLIDGLLLLAAGQEGKMALNLASCDVAVVLHQMAEAWTPAAAAQEVRLSYEGPTRCVATVDSTGIERIVANLLSNAVKFTPSGGSVHMELQARADEVVISVRDSGIGLDEEFKQRMFQRFEQGRPAVHAGARGSGIGLSLVKQIVDAHGGRIVVENPRSGGTIFRVALPRRADDETAAPAPAGVTHAPEDFGQHPTDILPSEVLEPSGTPEATILVAEDDPSLRAAIGRALADRYRVLLAGDGINALHLAKRHLPDLLVSDVGMPGMDGLELTRRFRAVPGNRLAPVLLLTAYGTVKDRLSGFDAGAVDYVTKPFVPEELRARIRSQLAVRDLALKLHQSEKLAAVGILSAGLAHEIRNPANALVNAIPPLRSLLPPEVTSAGTPTAELLDVMESCAGQIGMLSRQLLGFKRAGDILQDEESFATIVSRSLATVQPTIKEVTLRNECAYLGPVRCAAPLIVQVLANLLENGAHAAGRGGWVRIANRIDGDRLVVEVSDSGPGVPPDLRERIFEPFFTTKPPGKGTGLGLTTSREIVERHHGTLSVRDATGGGTVFQIQIPLGVSGASGGERLRSAR